MEKKLLALSALILVQAACLNISAQGELLIFDGQNAVKGQSWADPKDSVTFALSNIKPNSGKLSHLDLNAKWSNWWAGECRVFIGAISFAKKTQAPPAKQ